MNFFWIYIKLLVLLLISVKAEEEFCDRQRTILLSGVFNHRNKIFAYSWKDANDFQQQIVWFFEYRDNGFIQIGKSQAVERVFPGIPLFRAGFGLNFRCDSEDKECLQYNELVFVFFQNIYKVYRFESNRFAEELDENRIPWTLQSGNLVKQLGLGEGIFDTISGAAFVSTQSPKIFIIALSSLYVSEADIKAEELKWNFVEKSPIYSKVFGAFSLHFELIINRVDEYGKGLALIYSQNGTPNRNTTIWDYFSCKERDNFKDNIISEEELANKSQILRSRQKLNAKNDRYAALIISIVIMAIIVSNLTAAIFWLNVGNKTKR